MYGIKANTRKLILNSFANGELDLVMQFRAKFGDKLFEHSFPGHQRLIFYSIKNGHFNIVNKYLETSKPTISTHEIRQITSHIAHPRRFKNWITEYNGNEKLQSLIPFDLLFGPLTQHIVGSYDINLIDDFLELYPEKFSYVVSQTSGSSKGIQLRRHLKLRELL